jgi:hypothetical protein
MEPNIFNRFNRVPVLSCMAFCKTVRLESLDNSMWPKRRIYCFSVPVSDHSEGSGKTIATKMAINCGGMEQKADKYHLLKKVVHIADRIGVLKIYTTYWDSRIHALLQRVKTTFISRSVLSISTFILSRCQEQLS